MKFISFGFSTQRSDFSVFSISVLRLFDYFDKPSGWDRCFRETTKLVRGHPN